MGSITPIELTDTAIQMDVWICPCTVSIYNPATEEWFDRKLSLGILDLAYDDDYLIRPALLLEHLGTINLYRRVYHMFVVPVDPRQVYSSHEMSVDQGQSDAFANAYPLTYPSVLKVRRYLNQATQKNVEIMRYQSPVNAVSMNPSYDLGPKTGPVYLVSKMIRLRYTSIRKRRFRYTMSDRGSHPPLSSFFIDNQSKNDHSQNDETAVGHVAITWGMHRQVNADGGGYTPWSPWCRAFNMLAFIAYAGTSADDVGSLEMYHGSHDLHPSEIQVRLEGQRRRLCLASWQNLCIPQKPEDKALFPSSCEDSWAEDQMHNIANDPVMNTHLAIRIVMIEGLGRTLYEVQFDIDQTPKALQSFDEQ
ncbi:hypothetical protein FAUST_1621 [Fusarium austroamericanum]|uniref:Uncharacterized protein n=1 Tax=Fusarium austroamericanum TaxID=282268 RepID=A0AAN6HJJ6_FUSAU|nr:hypothetical protein FAUST_1621 [Fusarium austroamericanum]